jgi:GGDEF domain-containing protein
MRIYGVREVVWLWTAVVAWLFAIPLAIPLAVPEYALGGLTSYASAFGAVAAIAVVAIPSLRRLDVRWILVLLLLVFALGLIVLGEAVGQDPLQWLLALAYVGGAAILANRLGQKLVEFERGLEQLGAGSEDERVDSFEQGQEDIYREVRRARRYKHPATLMTLSVSGANAPVRRLVREVQRQIVEKYASAQVAKLLLRETDAAAVITQRNDHFVVLLPHTGAVDARHMAQRLTAAAAERWGLELRSGIATFPDQEVTFTGLLERAESALRESPASIHRTREPTVPTTDSPAAAAPGLDA